MDNGQEHQSRLGDAKVVKELDADSRREWSQNVHHQDHSMQKKIGLQGFVLEASA